MPREDLERIEKHGVDGGEGMIPRRFFAGGRRKAVFLHLADPKVSCCTANTDIGLEEILLHIIKPHFFRILPEMQVF